MRRAVELDPILGVREAVVRAEVDHEDVVGQLGGDLRRGAVREREDDDVVPGQVLRGRVDQHAVGERAQVRLNRSHEGARVRVRGQRADADMGVVGQEAKDLSPGVTTGSGNCD